MKAEPLSLVPLPEGPDGITRYRWRRWDIGQDATVRPPEPERAVGLSIDAIALLVHRAVVPATEQSEIRERGRAAFRPVAHVMPLTTTEAAAREAAALVPMLERAPKGRRDRPCPGPATLWHQARDYGRHRARPLERVAVRAGREHEPIREERPERCSRRLWRRPERPPPVGERGPQPVERVVRLHRRPASAFLIGDGRSHVPPAPLAFLQGGQKRGKVPAPRDRLSEPPHLGVEAPQLVTQGFRCGVLVVRLLEQGQRLEQGRLEHLDAEKLAGIVFADCSKMVERSPMLARLVERNLTTLSVPGTGSVLRAASSEARTLDGWRGHVIVVDELHEHPDGLVLQKLSASTKGRRQPLVLSITNAGFDRQSVCWQQHEYALAVLDGALTDDALFTYVCTLDACGDCRRAGHRAPVDGCLRCDSWRDEALWAKTNPSVPITPTLDYLRAQVREATGMPARESLVRRLNFCEWLTASSRWLDLDAWHGCAQAFTDEDLAGLPCYAGLDLGQSDDFSALVLVWLVEDGRVVVRLRFWVPESALTKFPNRQYDVWHRAGALVVTEGAVSDLDQIEAEVAETCRTSAVVDLGYGRRFAAQMALHLEGAGLTVTDVPQGYALNEPLMRLSDLVAGRRLVHDGNPVMTWMASNAVVRHGMRGEIRLDKEKAADKVDGIAALAMALSRALAGPPEVPEPRVSVFG